MKITSENRDEFIEKYLDGSLSPEELTEFEEQLKSDSSLAEAVIFRKSIGKSWKNALSYDRTKEEVRIAIEKTVREIVKKTCTAYGAKATIERTLEYEGFIINETDPVAHLTAEAMKRIKLKPLFVAMGGGSDTNIINSSKIRAINLSCGMQKIHSTDEFIMIKDLISGTRLAISLIETVK